MLRDRGGSSWEGRTKVMRSLRSPAAALTTGNMGVSVCPSGTRDTFGAERRQPLGLSFWSGEKVIMHGIGVVRCYR